jgi:hypothetical protein
MTEFVRHPEQPIVTDLSVTDDIFVKSHLIPKAETYLPQHQHAFSHASVIAAGSVRLWEGDMNRGLFKAPATVTILANRPHTFLTLEDNTVILCIHNVSRTGDIEVTSENNMVEG